MVASEARFDSQPRSPTLFFNVGVWLIYNVAFVSGIQQGDLVIQVQISGLPW